MSISTLYRDQIYLIDRTNPTAWDGNGDPIGTPDLPDGTDPEMAGNGDMKPWRIRLEITNTGVTGEQNHGVLKIRMDEKLTFLNSGPLLMNEDSKTKYLIEAYIIQTDSDGTDVESKRFRFQIGTPSLDVDENLGSIMTITLQEIQYRIKESVTSRELRFVSPKKALNQRIIDFNNDQVSGVNIISTLNNLPDVEELQYNYIPQNPQSIQRSFDTIFENLSEPQAVGGVFKDFYYDFNPTSATLITDMIADEIGRFDSGVVVSPVSADAFDSDDEQSVNSDFIRYKNHVVVRGSADAGSLPPEHSIFSSKWEHAKLRPEWSVSNSVNDRDGTPYNYLKGQTVKVTYDTGIPNVKKIIRYFKAIQNVQTPPPHPTISPTNWEEDFITIPEFDLFGSYEENDIVYQSNGSEYRFYRAKQNIFALTLAGWRNGKDSADTKWGSYLTAGSGLNGGFLKLPSFDSTHWEDISASHSGSGDIIPAHSHDSFVGFQTFSPWTKSIFDWEKNMIGLKGGSLISPTGNRTVGLVPDWNMAKDVYDKQDITDQFETISTKWVTKVNVTQVTSGTTGVGSIHEKERYHGNRIILGASPSSEFTTDFNEQFSSGSAGNRLAQWDKTGGVGGGGIWRFSRAPETGDFVTNLDEGNIYYWTGSSWQIGWEYERIRTESKGKPHAAGTYAHPVKDIYKVKGFEGTPSNAIEFRYVWNTTVPEVLFDILDDDNSKALYSRLASRGAWLWWWFPNPRLPIGETSKDIGDNYGGNGKTPAPASGFTTLNIYNNTSDRKQNLRLWNNGLNTEDAGKISGLHFKMKVGIFADSISDHNDDNFDYLSTPISGLASVPMIFWAIDQFDRIWFKRFSLRRNNEWDSVTIEFGDLAQRNLYLPRWDELRNFLGIPLSGTAFLLKEREYTGVQFDWRFVKGWGVMLADGYDDKGFYNGGIDSFKDKSEDVLNQISKTGENIFIAGEKILSNIGEQLASWGQEKADLEEKHDNYIKFAYTNREQATIAIDDLYFVKELVVNSDEETVPNARTVVEFGANLDDYINAKAIAKAKRERLSFYPQFWSFRSIGNVKLRVGQLFGVKGDRIPDNPSNYPVWSSSSAYNVGTKVQFYDGTELYSYRAIESTATGQSPLTHPTKWENLNKLAISNIKHIIDGSGYNVEIMARRKFITTGE